MSNGSPTLDKVLDDMLNILGGYLPPPAPPLPAPGISVISLTERALAIGNRRGTERRGSFAEIALKGGRLDVVARFQVWANGSDEADIAITELQKRLLLAKDELWVSGFLRTNMEETSLAEYFPVSDAWFKTTDYRVLYEYHYFDTDDAESIIVRIPILSDLERREFQRERTVITDEMARWDDEGSQVLEVTVTSQSSAHVAGLAILAYLPNGWTGNQVILSRLDRKATAPPTDYPTLAEFIAAITDETNPDRHAQVIFASVADFLAAFEPAGEPFGLGDWDEDGTPDVYQPGTLVFDPPIKLKTVNDIIRLSYHDPAFDAKAVVYLRAEIHSF